MTAPSDETKQLRPGLWATINDRYPGSMITREDFVPLAHLSKPLSASRLTFVSSAGIQPKGTIPFDVVHPVGDYSFRRVPSGSKTSDLEIHQIKYPTTGALKDLNVIFPIERLQELAVEGVIGELTPNFFSSSAIRWIRPRSSELSQKTLRKPWSRKGPMPRCCVRLDQYDISPSRSCSALLNAEDFRQFR